MAELAGQHFGRERLEDSLIGDMDEEQVRMQRLKLIQMNDLGITRREEIVTNDHKEKLVRLNLKQLEAKRACNKPGSLEYKQARADDARLNAWKITANFKDDFTPEEGTDDFEGGVEALGNTHRQALIDSQHETLVSEPRSQLSRGKSGRGDFSQRSRAGGQAGSRGRGIRPSAVSRVVREPPSLPTPMAFDVKPNVKFPPLIRPVVNLPLVENIRGRSTTLDDPTHDRANSSNAPRENAARGEYRGGITPAEFKHVASPVRLPARNVPIPVSGWGSDKLASPGDFLNAYKVTMGGAKAKPEPDPVTISQGSRQDTIKPTPVDAEKANEASVKDSQESEVIFSKEIDEAPQVSRVLTPTPTSAASKDSFSKDITDLEWDPESDSIRSEKSPGSEATIKSETDTGGTGIHKDHNTSNFPQAQALLAQLVSLSLPANVIANLAVLSQSLKAAPTAPTGVFTSSRQSTSPGFADPSTNQPLSGTTTALIDVVASSQPSTILDPTNLTVTQALEATPPAPTDVVTSYQQTTAISDPVKSKIRQSIDATTTAPKVAAAPLPVVAAPESAITKNRKNIQETEPVNVAHEATPIIVTDSAVSQPDFVRKKIDYSSTEVEPDETEKTASDTPDVGGIAETLIHRQDKWTKTLLGLPPIEGNLEKSLHFPGKYLAPKEVDIYTEGRAKKPRLLGEHLRPVGRSRTHQRSPSISSSSNQSTQLFQARQGVVNNAFAEQSDRLYVQEPEKALQNHSTKPKSRLVANAVSFFKQQEASPELQKAPFKQQDAPSKQQVNLFIQTAMEVPLESHEVVLYNAHPTQSLMTQDRGFRAEYFTPNNTPEFIARYDLGHAVRHVIHHGGYTVRLLNPKRSISRASSVIETNASQQSIQSDTSFRFPMIEATSNTEQPTTESLLTLDWNTDHLFTNYRRPVPGQYEPPDWLPLQELPDRGGAGAAMRTQLKDSGVEIPANASFKVKEISKSITVHAEDIKKEKAVGKPSLGSSTWSRPKSEPQAPNTSFSRSIWAKPATGSDPAATPISGSAQFTSAATYRADPGAAARAQYYRGRVLPSDSLTARTEQLPNIAAGLSNGGAIKPRADPGAAARAQYLGGLSNGDMTKPKADPGAAARAQNFRV